MKKVEGKERRALAAFARLAGFFAFFLGFGVIMPAALPGQARADVPVKFTYQGNLRQSGFLVNGTRSMVFRIYDSSSSTTALWTSPAYAVEVTTGVFSVALEPVLSDWETGSLWLEMVVEGNKMSPRDELTSSPYAVNSLMISGKRYTTASSAPIGGAVGDLWLDTVTNTLKFWNGSVWVLTTGSGIPGVHAFTHAAGGSDPIVNLGTHTVTGSLVFNDVGIIGAIANVPAVTITTNVVITGTLNPSSPLLVGGAGYSVTFSSAVYAGWYHGDGSDLYNLDASKIATGQINGDRIAPGVIASTHIANNTITRFKLNQSGCANGQLLKWDNTANNWICADDNFSGAGAETDPLSIHNQSTLQANTTFYVSSGTVNNLTVSNSLNVFGPTRLVVPGSSDFQTALNVFTPQVRNHSGQIEFGLQDLANQAGYVSFVGGNFAGDEYISIGIKNAEDILSIKGNRNIGIGTNDPWEPLDIYRSGGGGGIRFNSDSAEFKIGIPAGESNLRISNTNGLSKGQYTVQGITMDASDNVGIGGSTVNSKFAVIGNDSQAYSVAVGTGTSPYQVVVTTSGAVGVGTAVPQASLEVAGHEAPGSYVMILRSGSKISAWLRNK